MMRKLGALAVIPVVSAAAAVADSKATDEQAKTVKKYKPQDLPIYTTIFDDGAKKWVKTKFFDWCDIECRQNGHENQFVLISNEINNVKLSFFNILLIFRAAPVQSEPSVVRSTIEGGVKAVRETCCDCVNGIKDKKKPLDEFVSTGIEHSQCKTLPFSLLFLMKSHFYAISNPILLFFS